MKRENFKKEVCNESLGEINFTKKKIRRNIKYVFKVIIFVIISITSGILSSFFVVDYKYNKAIKNSDLNTNTSHYSDEIFKINNQSQQGDVSWIVDRLKSSLVTIAKEDVNFKDNNSDGILGTGVVFDNEGHIVTNLELLKGSKQLYVKPSSHASTPIKAECILENETMDIAILEIQDFDLPSIKLADSRSVRPGENVIAMGNTFGRDDSCFVSRGIISSINSEIQYVDINGVNSNFKVFKTDADINKYNSGGVLADSNGYVIGINSNKLSSKNGENSVGLVISAEDIKNLIDKAKMQPQNESKKILGFIGGELKKSDSSEIEGIYVQEVDVDGPLGKAGIKPTDIILEFEDNKVTSIKQLLEYINQYKSQSNVKIKIRRNGEISVHDVVLNKAE